MEVTKLGAAHGVRTFVKQRNSLRDDRAWKAIDRLESWSDPRRGRCYCLDAFGALKVPRNQPRVHRAPRARWTNLQSANSDNHAHRVPRAKPLVTRAWQMTIQRPCRPAKEPGLIATNDGPCTGLLNRGLSLLVVSRIHDIILVVDG